MFVSEEEPKDISAFLRDFRKSVKISQRELRNASGVNVETISKWERGLTRPSANAITRIQRGYAKLAIEFPVDKARDVLQFSKEYSGSALRNRFRMAASRARLSMEQLASSSGLPLSTLQTWLSRGTIPASRDRDLEHLAVSLDVSPAWLRSGPDSPMPSLSGSYYHLLVNPDFEDENYISVFKNNFVSSSDTLARSYFDLDHQFPLRALSSLPVLVMQQGKWRTASVEVIGHRDRRVTLQVSKTRQATEIVPTQSQAALVRALGILDVNIDAGGWILKRGDLRSALKEVQSLNDVEQSDEIVLQQRPAAFQFALQDGNIVAAALREDKPSSISDDLRAEVLGKAARIKERLSRTQTPQHVIDTIDRLIDELGATSDLRPGVLLSRSRSVDSVISAYDSEEGRAELFPDAQSMLRDLAETLDDLKATFPSLASIEASRLALRLDPDTADEALTAADDIAIVAQYSEVVDSSAVEALKFTSPDIEETRIVESQTSDPAIAAEALRARLNLISLRLLDVRNFVAQAIVAAKREGGEFGKDALRSSRKGVLEGIGEGSKEITKGAIKGGFLLLVNSLFGPLVVLAVLLGSFGQLKTKAKSLSGSEEEADGG